MFDNCIVLLNLNVSSTSSLVLALHNFFFLKTYVSIIFSDSRCSGVSDTKTFDSLELVVVLESEKQSCKKRSTFLRAKFSKFANLPQNVVKLAFPN